MIFRLACGDVMPGCPATFEDVDRSALLEEVATHAAGVHGIIELTPEVRDLVEQHVEVDPA